ncbi:MAG: hypothetical protein FJ211_02825 [Ignavibacteria bacterium]|nr:hypothetical protein [Ignavibacteria bacterium]
MQVLNQLFVLLLAFALCSGASIAQINTANIAGFIPNVGQWPSHVQFVAQQPNAVIWITTSGVVVDEFTIDQNTGIRTGVVTREVFSFSTANANVSTQTERAQQVVTFLRGSDAKRWVSTSTVESVTIEIEPGVQLRYSHAADGRVQRTVDIDQHHDARNYMMRILGGVSTQHNADVTPVTSTVYGSYIGGPGAATIAGVEYLSNGDVLAAGTTSELSLPNSTGGYSQSMKGTSDGFLIRFDSRLQRARSYTFLGGTADEKIRAICKDGQNAVYVTGETTSTDFPITSGVTGKLYKAGTDGFVAKLDSTLTTLSIGMYHGATRMIFHVPLLWATAV